MSNVTVRTFTPYINKLRKEAEDLRNDTMVSMAEGIRNEIIAKRLDEIANDIENLADATQYS